MTFFLCGMLLLPNLVNAKIDVAGDTKGMLNDNGNGSFYIADKKNNVGGALDTSVRFAEGVPLIGGNINSITFGSANWVLNKVGIGVDDAAFTLFNANPSNPKLTSEEFKALKQKLTEDGSPLADKITINNVSRQNSPNVSTFVYDPTGGNTNDALNIGYATKKENNSLGGNFYTAVKPARPESAEANEQLNIIDKVQGRQEGTTIRQKAEWYNLQKEAPLLQQKVDKAEDDLKKAQQNYERVKGTQEEVVARAAVEAAERELDITKQDRDANQLAQQQKQNDANNYTQTIDEGKCDWGSSISNCILWGAAIGTNLIFKLTSFGVYIAGTLFDYSLELSINSAEFLKKLGVVELTWSFIRDILNMTFIFILLFTAVQILIGNDAKYNARKILTNVVIFAILMNFSLFAAKLMVDGSNIVSLKIYEAMKTTDGKNSSITLRVMDTVGLAGLYNVSEIFTEKTIQAQGTCANNPTSLITVSVLGSIFLIILTLALGLAAILFLIRLVNIIYLFIRSPLWVWGYVIPGNQTMNRISSSWWQEMQHVLLFPIIYLFQILIAVIIFSKLGEVQKGGGASLLDLICNADATTGGFGASISLVAIFAIVIMFLMKAISYGVKHVGDGGEGAFGNKFGDKWANKFAGAQRAMTVGLAKKAGGMSVGVAKGASVGAAKVPLRLATGLGYGVNSGLRGNGFWKGANDGFSNPGINLKETVGSLARDQVLRDGAIANFTGFNKLAGAVAKKYEDPTNILGETRKKADERRTLAAIKHQGNINSAAEKKYKILTQEEWEKKNGKIVTDDDVKKYEEHVMEMIEKRADATIGKGIVKLNDSRTGESHLETLRKKAMGKAEDVIDKNTNTVIGKKVKFSETAMQNALISALDYHSDGKLDSAKHALAGKTKLEAFRNIRASAKIKAVKSDLEKSKGKALSKDAAKKEIESLEKSIQKIQKIQDNSNKAKLDECIKNDLLYTGEGDNEKTIVEFNKTLDKAINETDPLKSADLVKKAERLAEAHETHIGEQLVKKQNSLASKIKAKEEKEAADSK